jgi:hypothetical protein
VAIATLETKPRDFLKALLRKAFKKSLGLSANNLVNLEDCLPAFGRETIL